MIVYLLLGYSLLTLYPNKILLFLSVVSLVYIKNPQPDSIGFKS